MLGDATICTLLHIIYTRPAGVFFKLGVLVPAIDHDIFATALFMASTKGINIHYLVPHVYEHCLPRERKGTYDLSTV